jgi:hypothetical protein
VRVATRHEVLQTAKLADRHAAVDMPLNGQVVNQETERASRVGETPANASCQLLQAHGVILAAHSVAFQVGGGHEVVVDIVLRVRGHHAVHCDAGHG